MVVHAHVFVGTASELILHLNLAQAPKAKGMKGPSVIRKIGGFILSVLLALMQTLYTHVRVVGCVAILLGVLAVYPNLWFPALALFALVVSAGQYPRLKAMAIPVVEIRARGSSTSMSMEAFIGRRMVAEGLIRGKTIGISIRHGIYISSLLLPSPVCVCQGVFISEAHTISIFS